MWKEQDGKCPVYGQPITVESGRGDPDSANKRLTYLDNITQIIITDEARALADTILRKRVLPEKAAADALHISIAANHHIDYLLTWNCTHINNAAIKPVVRRICAEEGYICPEICTPQELMEDIQNG